MRASTSPICAGVGKDGNVFYKMRRKMHRATLYVVRADMNQETPQRLTMSAPCARCLDNIRRLGIKRIVFSDAAGRAVCVKTRDYETTHESSARKTLRRRRARKNQLRHTLLQKGRS